MVTTPSITPSVVAAQAAQAAAIAETAAMTSMVEAARPDREGRYGVKFMRTALPEGRVTRFELGGEDAFIRTGIRHIISSRPMLATPELFPSLSHESEYSHVRKYAAGELSYPRMETLHSLLCRGRSPHEMVTVENGCGSNPHLTMALVAMGARVFLREPDEFIAETHARNARRHLPPEWIGRMIYLTDAFKEDHSIPANIVYWINPTPTMFALFYMPRYRTPEKLATLVNYMGREVVPGGFLVLQTPEDLYHDLYFDHSRWIPLFDSANNIDDEMKGIAFPTDLPRLDNYLRIFRRIA